jgi:hypothetical protein
MEFTTPFELQSQATRLGESVSYSAGTRAQTGLSPSMMPCSKRLLPGLRLTTASQDYNSLKVTHHNMVVNGAISQLYYKLEKLYKEVEQTVLVFQDREQHNGYPLPIILHPIAIVYFVYI